MGKRQDPFYQAQAILSRRDHSTVEVQQKLQRKGFTPAQVTETLARLQEQNLLNDKRFARAYVENTLRFKPVGPRWLRAKLVQKGVGDSLIEKTIAQAFANNRQTRLIADAIARYQRTHRKHADDRQRLYRHLASRGFDYDAITSHVNA